MGGTVSRRPGSILLDGPTRASLKRLQGGQPAWLGLTASGRRCPECDMGSGTGVSPERMDP